MALIDVAKERLGSHKARIIQQGPCQGPSNGALFGLPTWGQVVGGARRSQSQEALRCQAADFNPQISPETRPGSQSGP
jgi:hypothetical protein